MSSPWPLPSASSFGGKSESCSIPTVVIGILTPERKINT